jgi:hypothetical protein
LIGIIDLELESTFLEQCSLILPSESRKPCRGSLFSTTEHRDNQAEVLLVTAAVAKAFVFPLPHCNFICSSRSNGSHLEDEAMIKCVTKEAFASTLEALDFVTRSSHSKIA